MAMDPWHKEHDLCIGDQLTTDNLGESACSHLATKGFCVVDAGLHSEDLSKALTDIEEMDSMGKFITPASLIAEGLFGQEGSSRIAEMDAPGDLSTDGEHIRKIDEMMTDVCTSVNDFLIAALDMDCRTRTHGLVHETDTGLSEIPDLDEKQASTWLNTFVRAKVVLIVCLGPSKGTLELRPFDDDEAEAVEIPTTPGTMIILRADALWHKHFAHGKVNLLTCHLLEPKHFDKRTSHQASRKMTPVARAIDNWCLARLQVLKSAQEHGQDLGDLPMDFRKAMNQVCFKGQRVAIRSCGGKLASTYDTKQWYTGLTAGPDFMLPIGQHRWDHTQFFDPDPEGWRNGKTFVRHCCFVEGIDLFDNKLFGLSPAESTSMDPHQTNILECGYEAMFRCGYKKKTIMNTVGGVYVGATNTDWQFVPKSCCSASCATGSSPSITSNRFSFCLGLKGPSLTIDSEGASGLMAVHLGAEGVLDKGRGVPNAYSLSGSVHFSLGPYWWPQLQAAGLLSQDGRCKTFDESADGYARGDGIVLYCIKRLTDVVDGQTVMVENEPLMGVLAASYMNNNGMNASMGAPSAAAEQEMICQALRNSSITAIDIESIEAHGDGSYLGDAIESGAFMRALRYDEDSVQDPLIVTCVKTSVGDGTHASGVMGLLRVLMSQSTSLVTPNCHLMSLNPHMEFGDLASIGTEHLEHRLNVSYNSINAKGFGGTNVHAITWGRSNEPEDQEPVFNRKAIVYWPGGGGQLEDEVVPRKKAGYFIAGTWNRWMPEQMEPEGESSFGFTVVLGENRWEKFQIWLDGSEKRKLHPDQPNAPKGREVLGPVEDAMGLKWAIDGRSWAQSEELEEPEAEGDSQALAKIETEPMDTGKVGDRYRVHLRVAGKYRTVEWERLERRESAPPEKVPEGRYSMFASWNNWSLDEMFRDDSEPGVNFIEVTLVEYGGYFAVVRNEDMEQVIYPDRFEADQSAAVLGPDELGEELFWFIPGVPGDVFRVEFNRRTEFGLDRKKVSWKKTSA